MKYKIEFEPTDIVYIGKLLDKQPHGEVAKIVANVQAQITAQDQAEQARSVAAFEAARDAWFEAETAKRADEAAKVAEFVPDEPKAAEPEAPAASPGE